MGVNQAQAGKLRQAWQPLLLSLAVVWAAASGCGSEGSPLPNEGAGESQYLSPTPLDVGLPDGTTVPRDASLQYDDKPRMDLWRYSKQADRMALLGNWEEAVSAYSQAIAVEPSDSAAYVGRAKAHYMLGEHEKAVKDYTNAIEIRETPRLYMKRGHVLLQLSRFAQADQDYHRAISLGSSSSTAYEGMGEAHRLQGEFDEAIRNYTVAIGPNDDGWWAAYYFRGLSYFQLRQFQRALEDFHHVIVLQPHSGHAYFARGVTRWLGGQCSAALDDFQAFVALSDDEEAFARAQDYIEQLEAIVRCEPRLYAPILLSSQGMAWLRVPWE